MTLDTNEGVMVAQPGPDLGLWYFADKGFGDFVLRLQFRIDSLGDNSGVFLRFRDPRLPAPGLGDPRVNTDPAWIAVDTGFEAQIDETARPDGTDMHRTGALYAIPTTGPGAQTYSAVRPCSQARGTIRGDRLRRHLPAHPQRPPDHHVHQPDLTGRQRDQTPHPGSSGCSSTPARSPSGPSASRAG
jgi:hypothetical protein